MRQALLSFWIFGLIGLLALPALAQDAPEETPPPETRTVTRSSASHRASSSNVRPFQTWIEDAAIARGVVVEPFFDLSDFGNGNRWRFGAQAGFEAADNFEAGVRWSVDHLDFNSSDVSSQTGPSDLRGYARYQLQQKNPQIAGGVWVDLPVGTSDVGASNFNVDVFGAVRWQLEGGWVLMSNAGIESVEFADSRDTGVHLGGAALYPLSQDLSALGELLWRSASEYGVFSLGLDYATSSSNHLRAAVGFGFDDLGPDLQLLLGFLMGFD